MLGPGSERATIFEPQEEIVFTQGDASPTASGSRVDVVTAASPNSIAPPDVKSGASRRVESGSLDWTATYEPTTRSTSRCETGSTWSSRSARGTAAWACAAPSPTRPPWCRANALEVFDWFDRFDIHGDARRAHDRNTTTGSVGFTQVLTPTTVANVNYGITVDGGGARQHVEQRPPGQRGARRGAPARRRARATRWSFAASQWLPWNGALRLYYRFYADDWGIVAHSMEGQLMQRLSPELYIGGYYRFHTQTGANFFTTLAPSTGPLRVADSDLAPLESQTIGGKVVLDCRSSGRTCAPCTSSSRSSATSAPTTSGWTSSHGRPAFASDRALATVSSRLRSGDPRALAPALRGPGVVPGGDAGDAYRRHTSGSARVTRGSRRAREPLGNVVRGLPEREMDALNRLDAKSAGPTRSSSGSPSAKSARRWPSSRTGAVFVTSSWSIRISPSPTPSASAASRRRWSSTAR